MAGGTGVLRGGNFSSGFVYLVPVSLSYRLDVSLAVPWVSCSL